jgi:hypothetical protein
MIPPAFDYAVPTSLTEARALIKGGELSPSDSGTTRGSPSGCWQRAWPGWRGTARSPCAEVVRAGSGRDWRHLEFVDSWG